MTMKKPVEISLVIPVYGVEQYIAEFACSVFSQNYPNVQFVFVNDGTKDNSIKVLKDLIDDKFQSLKERIIIVDKENAGLPAARKTGMEYVTGDYIYHVDPDDWLTTGSLEAIAAKAEETDADIIFFNYVKEYENRRSVKKERAYDISEKLQYIRNMYNHRAYGALCNKCVKRTLYTDGILFHPRYSYAEDCYLTVQLVSKASSLAYLDMDVYHYRKNNPHSITHQARRRRKEEYALNFLDLYEKYLDLPSKGNPLCAIKDDIIIQAGWYSLLYRLDFYKRFPYLASAVRKARIRGNSDVLLPCQLIVKFISLFRV
jgi:glycosyltransferase involved in cell wall biosynthesis